MNRQVEFRVLGPLQVLIDSEPLLVRAGRQRALLVSLLLRAGTSVSVDELAGNVWGDEPPARARATLQTYVMRLRQLLGPSVPIRTVPDGYLIDVDEKSIDLMRFEPLIEQGEQERAAGNLQAASAAFAAALGLWRGPALVDVPSEILHRDEVPRLDERRLHVLERRVEVDLELGRHGELVAELSRLTSEHPLRERFWAQLMLALYRSSRQAEALEAFRQLDRTLDEQLGIDPSAPLQRIHHEVLLHDGGPSSAGPAARPSDSERTGEARPSAGTEPRRDARLTSGARPVLSGRDEQLAMLRRWAEAARAGRGSTVSVRGVAGIGKTSLLEAWAGSAAGMRVAWATGAEAEQGFAFAVARQLLDPLAVDADVSRLVQAGAEPTQEAMHGLYRLVAHACDDGPVALVVDDSQWADAPSLRWLDYLTRRIGGLPLLLVMAMRPEEGPAEQVAGHLITLPPLSPIEVTEWVRREWPDAPAEFCGACAEATEGNPALLGELFAEMRVRGVEPAAGLAPWVTEVTGRLSAVATARRLSELDEATRRVARALLVLGDGADWPVVAALSGLNEAESRGRAERLRRIGVLARVDPARFRHPSSGPVLTEVVMTPADAAAGHARAAELLYADGAAAERVAEHLLLAEPGTGGWRVEVLREASRAARGSGVPAAGARYLRRALREPVSAEQRGELVLELGTDEVMVDPEAAARRLAAALPGLTDPLTRAQVISLRAEALVTAHRYDQAIELLEPAVADVGELAGSDDPFREIWLRLQAQLVLAAYQRPATFPKAELWAGRLRAFDVVGDTRGQRAVLRALALPAMMGKGTAATVNDLLDRGLRGELATEGRDVHMLGLAGQGYALTDRLDDAALRYGQMRDVADRYGAAFPAARAAAGLANVAWLRGERIPVVAPLEGAQLADARARLSLLTVALNSLVERGDPEAAAKVLAQYAAGDLADSALWAPVVVTAGRVRAECGDLSGGLALLLVYGGSERQAGLGNPAAAPWRTTAARICAALGRPEQARELAVEELEAAHRWGTPRVIGAALRCLGTVVGGAEGRALLAEAVTVLDLSPARLELAWAKYEWGLAVRQAGDLRVAVSLLSEALKLAELSGARLLAGRARAELVAAGVRVDPAPATIDG